MSRGFEEHRSSGGVREVSPAEAADLAASGAPLIDIRERHEWDEGHITGAVHIPRSRLPAEIGAAAPDRDVPVVLYCATGVRSLLGVRQLMALGYASPASMAGGFRSWKAEGRGWTRPIVLSTDQQRRYSRHVLIPEVGPAGQERLLASKVLVVGAGGLGSPVLLYLAAAGVGRIGIVDYDTVDLSNLQRQVVHASERVGRSKTESAAVAIRALNPDVRLDLHDELLTEENARRLIDGWDVIVDGTDTFETRYVLNDAAVRAGIPVVHASVYRFEGQLTVFMPHVGPCYRCLFPMPPPPDMAGSCSVVGVLGVVPGTMGMLQATETLKLLLGIGEPLVGRLLVYDALDGTFEELRLRRDPHCPACGDGEGAEATTGSESRAGSPREAPVEGVPAEALQVETPRTVPLQHVPLRAAPLQAAPARGPLSGGADR